ncbi:MAG: esterase [Oscillospiraceae bacterium]|nr:esterase [Oscillospiraceae bacterium]
MSKVPVIYEYGDPASVRILIQPVDDHDLAGIENEAKTISELAGGEFRLIAVKIEDWNRDLSPWEAPPVFGKEAFGGGAAETLAEFLKLCDDKSKRYYIGGYSLAGLFALWAVRQTDAFEGAAAASPSVWFPGFADYMKERSVQCGRVYLSLGDREERTRNPIMAAVGDRIRELHAFLSARGTDCVLEWNQGNHFRDADLRTARAFAWLLNR